MELRAVDTHDLPGFSRANLIETYLRLASVVPGASIIERGYCTQAKCLHDISFANFVFDFQVGETEIALLADILLRDRPFRAFHMTGDRPQNLPNLLRASHYFQVHHLRQMAIAPGAMSAHPAPRYALTRSPELDPPVAKFMVSEFFGNHDANFQNIVLQSTLKSKLNLHACVESNQLIAGVMTHENENSVGIYNLCVRKNWRSKGVGTSIVKSVLKDALRQGKCVVLQCEPKLEAWYASFGFESVGDVHCFARNRTN